MGAIQRWNYRGGRPGWWARINNRLVAITFAAGVGPDRAATLEVHGHKSGRTISFPVVVADYEGERYLVAMLGQKTNWVRNLRADGRAVLRHGQREDVSLVEDLSDMRTGSNGVINSAVPTGGRSASAHTCSRLPWQLG